MGLDMNLYGVKDMARQYGEDACNEEHDNFIVDSITLDLGYWRKHPNLHGFIVENFAGGKDGWQKIDLSKEDVLKIIQAVNEDNLPETKGFFFGVSCPSYKDETLRILNNALAWYDEDKGDCYGKKIYYQASW